MLDLILKYRRQLINTALFLVAVLLVYVILKWLVPFVIPLIIGILIALLIEPLVRLLSSKARIPRWISSLIALLLVFGGGVALVVVLSAKLVIELADLAKKIPYWSQLVVDRFYGDVTRLIEIYNTNLTDELKTKINENLMVLGESLGKLGVSAAQAALHGISSVPNLVVILLLSVFIGYFVSKDFLHFKRKIGTWMPVDVKQKGKVVYADLAAAIGGYIRGQTILITITAVQVLAGLLILQVPYAFSLSLLAAFLDILPLLGTGTLFVPWAAFSLITGDIRLGIGLLIVYGLIVVVRQVMEPRILANTIGLDPLATIVVMYAGYQAAGFIGLLLAPFILIAFQSLLKVRAFDLILGSNDKNGPPAGGNR
ncbi:sporulation integral membrane protein YtvI [Effusibacillus lacus]|uniref:Sporulation integral membrane protein YtvI n=1 Tax=Effusibacillus lacus TaxID=1348429 RepID=A0A292YMR4_9BACL|nr:sporulation integral membrane protein YtvI [Effusibacillus lacus]TCS72336.1 sporulation integral membrane protein YtvI [Effusibacillus lacus]GAX90201.1 sporulation integral membrane protein YtvI [Effusibacillus lacus]